MKLCFKLKLILDNLSLAGKFVLGSTLTNIGNLIKRHENDLEAPLDASHLFFRRGQPLMDPRMIHDVVLRRRNVGVVNGANQIERGRGVIVSLCETIIVL